MYEAHLDRIHSLILFQIIFSIGFFVLSLVCKSEAGSGSMPPPTDEEIEEANQAKGDYGIRDRVSISFEDANGFLNKLQRRLEEW